jgi:hypothetical protein
MNPVSMSTVISCGDIGTGKVPTAHQRAIHCRVCRKHDDCLVLEMALERLEKDAARSSVLRAGRCGGAL